MNNPPILRPLNLGEEIGVCNLVARSFNEFVTPDFPEEGIEDFFNYANPRANKALQRQPIRNCNRSGGMIEGMIEMREMRHVSMLFVNKAFHRKGLGKELLRIVLDNIKSDGWPPRKFAPHSSRFAVPFYESFGFIRTKEEKIIYGVIHISMALNLWKLD